MVRFLFKILATAVAVLFAAYILKGVHIDSTLTAIFVAVVLGLLNTFVKPILILLTIPFTIFTLGLFLLVINIIIIELAAEIVPGFKVDSWLAALLFSIIVSLVASFIGALISSNESKSSS